MKKAVIFDMDGLLVDTEPITYGLDNRLLGRFGCSFSMEDYTAVYVGRSRPDNMAALIETYHLPITVPQACALMDGFSREYYRTHRVPLKPGAEKLMDYLDEHGVRIMLATSSQGERARSILEPLGIMDRFYGLTFASEVEHGKPHPDIFLKAAEKAGAQPSACLVLEDSEAGIRAASAAGIDVICVPDLKQPSEECRQLALAVLPDLEKAIPYI